MLMLDLMPMNTGWEQRDALEQEKPMKEEKDFWNSHIGTRLPWWIFFPHKISRRTTWHSHNGLTHNLVDYIFWNDGDSSPASTEPRAEHSRERISTATATWLWWKRSWNWRWTRKIAPKTQLQPWKAERPRSSRPLRSDDWGQIAALNLLEENIDNLTENIHGARKSQKWKRNRGWLITFWIYVTGAVALRREEKMALLQCRSKAKSIKKSE